jgi:hypothetical protein
MGTSREDQKERTVRELGGEVWAEISQAIKDEELSWVTKNKIVDVVMGVLARHVDSIIKNDEDLPVSPRP